jgi:hypothetical protein
LIKVLRELVTLSKIVHFEIVNDNIGNIVKTVKLKNAKVSLINYTNLNVVDWNESFERLTDYLENEIK